jgi:hypothetical protein
MRMLDQLPRERATVEAGVYPKAEYFQVTPPFLPYVERTLHPAFHVLDSNSTAYSNARIFCPSSYLRLNQQGFLLILT